ncbi:DEAD/DEAH box helicase family protein [Erysipelotrichia bacterium]
MKLKFKVQPYQTNAVDAVIDCFIGQMKVSTSEIKYKIDPGKEKLQGIVNRNLPTFTNEDDLEQPGFRNADIQPSDEQLLKNIQAVQHRQNLPLSNSLCEYQAFSRSNQMVAASGQYKKLALNACKLHLDIEMETGTGKTYCYIKTIFEMNKRYGWSKFIIIVPSVAIREGVSKSFEITAEHFSETYGKKVRYFIYNSKELHKLESFSSDAGINVMIINIQAFNSSGADNRRIYDELDDFQTRRPIDVISKNRPILILDEPQKMEGNATLESLSKFKPLMILRYSATHKTIHNKIHRLDALDAYNQKLVKKIAVRGITVKGLAGTNAYLYLESIEISQKAPPVARIELEVRYANGIKREVKKLGKGRDLFVESKELDQYRGFVISQIDAHSDTVEFTNGHTLSAGDATGDVTEAALRRIQIRETIKAHFEKEHILYNQGIKVLSLFFIDEVAKYRDYSQPDEKGEYARIFEEEYEHAKAEYLGYLPFDGGKYRNFLESIPAGNTHNGYFSIDKKTNKLADPKVKARGEEAGLSDDVDAYDLILKDKVSLLSLPTAADDAESRKKREVRFIFSHSALREGWDNPNVFIMCMLKHSDNTISRRQEVGRGLRISVNQNGERMDNPATVHDVNVLTVVASESYQEFVGNLQREISDSLSARPRKADKEYFTGKVIKTDTGELEVTPAMASQIYKYLLKNDYTDEVTDQIVQNYHDAKATGTLAPLPAELAPYADQIFTLIDGVFSETQLQIAENDRKPKANHLNDNFEKQEFKELWNRLNRKAVYRVEFDSDELIRNCIKTLDVELRVTPLTYVVQAGEQIEDASYDQIKTGQSFVVRETSTEYGKTAHSMVPYDLLGKISENTRLTRKTVAQILLGIQAVVFNQFKQNPEHFISECSRLINEQKATIVIERLSYDCIDGTHDNDIFTAGQTRQDFSKASEKLKKHIYDYLITDSKGEKQFATELDTSNEVVVYAKLPRGFSIPTPIGDYNPDWAIAFKKGSVRHIYFVAETKGSMSTLQLRAVEEKKIECARKFFDKLNQTLNPETVKYDVVTNYSKLMEIVGSPTNG